MRALDVTPGGRPVALSRRILLQSAAAAAAAGLLPQPASASGFASLVVGEPGELPIPHRASQANAGESTALDQSSARVTSPPASTTRAQLWTEQALSRVADPKVHWVKPPTGCLFVPYVSQYDGTPYARSNCGPASLSMVLAYLGTLALPAAVRADVNHEMHNRSVETGASWEGLVAAAQRRGHRPRGLYAARQVLHSWTTSDVDAELRRGDPVLVLVRFGLLPGRDPETSKGDHYSVVVGRDRLGRYYLHDPAYHDLAGAYRRLTKAQLYRAWTHTSSGIRRAGMVLQAKG